MGSKLLHRFRAERLLREEFEALSAGVMAGVAARLRAAGVQLDPRDLEACYAAAWHGLYAAVLDGQEIASPAGWLALVTYRRAIDEHRARRRIEHAPLDDRSEDAGACADQTSRAFAMAVERRDLAAQLDDRIRIRQLLEAMRARLSSREREAATLCYLHGLTRAEAATRMGISTSRMRKLMEGHGHAHPGVSAKLGVLVQTIDAGRWCEEQGSLMRGFAFGILDPQGERYRLARAHHTACSSCRAYVLSLRGLAVVLPPLPAMLHLVLGAGAAAGAGGGAAAGAGSGAAGTVAGSGGGATGGVGAAVPAGSGAGGAALSASGAAAGAAGGGWWLAGGPVGAKLAVGCLLALGVGAGCAALEGASHGLLAHVRTHRGRAGSRASGARASKRSPVGISAAASGAGLAQPSASPPQGSQHVASVAEAARASREFGPERHGAGAGQARAVDRAASVSSLAHEAAANATAPAAGAKSGSEGASEAAGGPNAAVPAAQREFAPG